MSWFKQQRQDFIRAQLEAFGQIRRKDIADRFEVSTQVASADIAEFIDAHPDAIIYDGRAKLYVLDGEALTRDNNPEECFECDGEGRIWNNADPTSGQWSECEACDSDRLPKGHDRNGHGAKQARAALRRQRIAQPPVDYRRE